VHVPGVKASAVVDPTGCGDAFRAALLFGLERGWDLVQCSELGNKVGAIKIASQGGQNWTVDRVALGL
jgi:adenosine kinase